jgi:hypothetical protein
MRPQPRASMLVTVDAPLGAAEKPIERLATQMSLTAAAILVGFLCQQAHGASRSARLFRSPLVDLVHFKKMMRQ